MKEMINKSFSGFATRHVELYEDDISSPTYKSKINSKKSIKAQESRTKMQQQLSTEIRKLIDAIVIPEYSADIFEMQEPEFLTVRREGHKFYGETSIHQIDNSNKTTYKIPEGICEIYYQNGDYLIGEFLDGRLQKEFIYISRNGNYLKTNRKMLSSKRMTSGFINEDTEPSTRRNPNIENVNLNIDSDEIKVSLDDNGDDEDFHNEYKLDGLLCEIQYNGILYKGITTGGLLNGRVEEKGKDYDFIGTYSMGERRYGTYVSIQNGVEYVGTFSNGKFEGLGKLRVSEGTYNGEFQNGLKNGEGQFEWKDGSMYKGEYKDDMRDGKGFYRSKEISFKGEWKKDERAGPGFLVVDGKGVGGEWVNNEYEMPDKFF